LVLQLEVPVATCLAWAQAAKAQGARVILNAAPMSPLPAALLKAADVLVVNEGELAALVGDVAWPLQAAHTLGPSHVVVTLGERGGRAFDGQRLIEWPGHAVPVLDTTGAGDTFVGALAAGLLAGLDFEPALRRANVAAALSCTAAGARTGMPDTAALAAAMR
jgi:ribokinase